MQDPHIYQAAEIICSVKRVTAFTGAGISAESGIPPFRGPNGLWSRYDSSVLDIHHFYQDPVRSWSTIKKIFYENFQAAIPNAAHLALSDMEAHGHIHAVITQNIDNLHQKAGSRVVIEYHGNSQRLICRKCGRLYPVTEELLLDLPPLCPNCHQVLKPDFVFFGEPIPVKAHQNALRETRASDVWLVIGTTGEVFPAASLPLEAKSRGKKIIEINIEPSSYTPQITDIFLQGTAASVMSELNSWIRKIDVLHAG
ncbi:MAG: NAD-dependent deacylase [Chloroflexi bacterium]|nr:NAD-dependent deacylase [Chloroflexota bacterium]